MEHTKGTCSPERNNFCPPIYVKEEIKKKKKKNASPSHNIHIQPLRCRNKDTNYVYIPDPGFLDFNSNSSFVIINIAQIKCASHERTLLNLINTFCQRKAVSHIV